MQWITKKLFRLLVALMLITQVACIDEMLAGFLGSAANTILNSGFSTPAPVGPESSGLNNATDEVGDDDDDDDAGVLPQASIPLPPGLENTTTSSVDMNGSAVSQGNVGSDNAGNSMVIASEFGASLEPKWNSFFASFNQAMATSSACPEDMDYAACVTIGEDGTYQATLANADEGTALQFYIYNPETGLMSEPASDTPNTNLVHVGNDILNITSDTASNLYGLSDEGKFVNLQFDKASNTIRVDGDVEEEYSFAQVSGATQIVYNIDGGADDSGAFVVLETEANVVNEYQFDGEDMNTTGQTSAYVCDTDICTPKALKLMGENVFYGTSYPDGSEVDNGRINEFYDNDTNRFTFADPSYYFTSLVAETHPEYEIGNFNPDFREIKAYEIYEEDVSLLKVAVAAVKNDDNQLRLFAKMGGDPADDWYITIDTRLDESQYTDVYDLQVLNEQDDNDTTDGRGVFTSNVGVTFFDFDASEYYSEDATPTSEFVMGPDLPITNIVSMAVNSDKTIGYVISSGDTSSASDDIITVVDLTGEAIKTDVGSNGVIALSDYLPNKTVTDLSPRTITYFTQDGAEFLLVTLGNTEAAFRDSAIVIEL